MVPSDFYTSLTEKGVIQLSGAEREKYLQGQVTADVASLKGDNALLACHCDFKGKTWSVSYLLSWKESLLLITHCSVIEKSLAELKKYGVFAKVDIIDASNDWIVTGGVGKETEAEIIRVFGHLPEKHQDYCKNDQGIALLLEGNIKRYLILQPKTANDLITIKPSPLHESSWEIEDIKAGIADVRAQTCNEFVPQMMNLQQLNAISFTKGCYMGQEVVARTKYLGKNKRAAFRLHSETSRAVGIGEKLEVQMGENWRPAGTVLRCGVANEQTWLLATLASDTEIGTIVRLKDVPEALFTVMPQPYELT
ncbi:MAG: tRNA-modifying protein YgfZ [Paraglaciecola sp.]|uniref:tRNA-modifying protein YgfZ n=1 Tax=Pseudomonadati TaxID=3379134 RepID=UPI00273F8BC6|nr:tRNA-modifying protein YgfZ [Paraglaciecola sp.]MDP5028924.1 tRNA-modifying protein YgfZ [Paraglaciecola sp.]MDP5132592.1 tRNA-modifying protein YgfZ [Paraglaciecola sp.]